MTEAAFSDMHLKLYCEADALYRDGKYKLALLRFAKALAEAPGDADTLWAMANCYSELGKPHLAERNFRRARAKAESSQRGDLLYNIANSLFDQRRSAAALRLYRLVPRKSSSFPLARRNIALLHRQTANPSVKGTSCGKPQAAPYVER